MASTAAMIQSHRRLMGIDGVATNASRVEPGVGVAFDVVVTVLVLVAVLAGELDTVQRVIHYFRRILLGCD